MALGSQERRSAPRIVAKLAMQVAGADDGSVLTTESINLSASGIQFMSRAFLSPLTKVQLTLLLPPFGSRLRRERMVQCEAIVVRCEEEEGARRPPRYELACYFSDVEGEDRILIEQYVGWRSLRRLPAMPAAAPKTAAKAAPKRAARAKAKPSKKAGAKKATKAAARKRPAARSRAGAAAKKKRA
ncbi:MAG TPA: PilZ domain-containing protein [Candidatus Eisenbacteria bacterium]|nr:PilZ domain-containing protein [Candidatus Eisenbacteria bacterium]